jgi:hypothetical protein
MENEKNNLNKDELQINRGFELLIRDRRKKSFAPKTFQLKFGKMISLLRREIHIHFDFYFDIQKK